MAWDKNSQEGQFITGLDAERVIVNEMRKKVTEKMNGDKLISHFFDTIWPLSLSPNFETKPWPHPGTTVSLSDVSF